MLEDALEHLVKGIVDHPEDVTVDLLTNRRGKTLEIRVHPDDLGKVIGRGGRTAKALRQVMTGVGGRGLRVDVVDTVVVGRIGRPHGVRGLATIEVRTDDPDLRFTPGTALRTDPPKRGPITVVGRKWHSGTLLLQLADPSGNVFATREDVEALRNTLLLVPVSDLPAIEDPDSFYDHQLVGLDARLPDGTVLGAVTAVRHE